jgi:PAS domain S-box-containing protein
MKTKYLKHLSSIHPKYIVSIFIAIAALMILSAIYELSENKREIYHILDEYANSIIYLVDISSANTVVSDQEMENLLSQHLMGVARNVKRIDSIKGVSDELLKTIAIENDVYRINIFNNNGEKLFSNHTPDSIHSGMQSKHSPKEFINPIIRGEESEIIIGFKEARFEQGNRFAVAVKRAINHSGVIVVNLDADSFLEFRKKIGFGKMIQDIGNKSGIEYIILQNNKEIVAANRPVDNISKFENDNFLKSSYESGITKIRVNEFNNIEIYEAVKPFIIEGEKIGIFRIGLSMDEINSAESRMYRRAVIISVILIIILMIVIGIIVSNQNFRMISDEYRKIQTFTGNVLDNMSQAVITTDIKGNIIIFNKKSEEIFNIKADSAVGKSVKDIFLKFPASLINLFEGDENINNLEINIKNKNSNNRVFIIDKTVNFDTVKSPEFLTVVMSDVTELREIEQQVRRNEKLIAMGELASAVAHEVRNPLNTINMISQRMKKEFNGKINFSDFNNLNDVLQSESKRINGIIEEFLRFARPPKLNLTEVNTVDFLNEIKSLVEVQTKVKNIEFRLISENDAIIKIDPLQMKQALINVLNNAIDAVNQGGNVTLKFNKLQNKVLFEISDNGVGISKENLNKIFNLYYTTKSKGTGLGLSIVQQIVSQHNGTIFVDSPEGKGTKFIIEVPV